MNNSLAAILQLANVLPNPSMLSFGLLQRFVRLAALCREHILLLLGDVATPPESLYTENGCLDDFIHFLCDALSMDHNTINLIWSALKEEIWSTYEVKPTEEDKMTFRTHGQFQKLGK
jgi:hypothetical protein